MEKYHYKKLAINLRYESIFGDGFTSVGGAEVMAELYQKAGLATGSTNTGRGE